jgi:hypothetical protein
MEIIFDLGGLTNHDNQNAVDIDTDIAAGSVIDTTGAVVSGVSFNGSATPFSLRELGGGTAFAEVNDTTENSLLRLGIGNDSVNHTISGLPAGDYTISVFGSRDITGTRPASISVNSQSAVSYDASNEATTYAEHVAEDVVTLNGSEDLVINYIRSTSPNVYLYANQLKIVSDPAPTITSVDTDNEINPSQTDVSVAISNAPATVTSLDQINLGGTVSGETITGGTDMLNLRWNSGTPLFDVPAGMTIANGYDIHVKYTP